MSSLEQAGTAIVGAVIGGIVGGPGGAIQGFQIGLLAGNALFPVDLPKVIGPKLQDINTTTARLGEPVGITFGAFAVPGHVIALGCVTETERREQVGGKGGPEQTIINFTYNQTIAVGLCEGIICDIRRIWENGELVYDTREQQVDEGDDEYAARLEASGQYSANFTLYVGDESQEADPDLEVVFGEGMVPGFRGLAYVVFPDRLLQENQALRHPQWRFEVVRGVGERGVTTPTLLDGPLTGFDSTSLFADWAHNRFFCLDNAGDGDTTGIRAFRLRSNTEYLQRTYNDILGFEPLAIYEGTVGPDGFMYLAIAHDNDSGSFLRIDPETLDVVASQSMGLFSSQWNKVTSTRVTNLGLTVDFIIGGALLQNTIKVLRGDNLEQLGSRTDSRDFITLCDGPRQTADSTSICYGISYDGSIGGENDTIDIVKIECGIILFINPISGEVEPIPEVSITTVGALPVSDIRADWLQMDTISGLVFDRDDETIMFGITGSTIGGITLDGFTDRIVKVNPETLEVVLSVEAEGPEWSALIPTFDDNHNLSRIDRGRYAQMTPLGTGQMRLFNTRTGEVTSEDWTDILPGSQSQTGEEIYDALTDCLLTYIGGTGPVLLCLSTCSSEGVLLGDIVGEICDRSGVPAGGYDVSELTQNVPGYGIMRSMPGRTAIEVLRPIGSFDAVESGEVIKFPTRGRAVSRTFDVEDLSAHPYGDACPPAVTTDKIQSVELPRLVRVHYIAHSRDYEPGEKLSNARFSPEVENEVDVEVPASLDDTQALRIADVLQNDIWVGRWSHGVQWTIAQLDLEPTDVVQVPVDGRLYRARIESIDDVSGGLIRRAKLVRDDDGSYVSTAVAPDPIGPIVTGPTIVSPSTVLLLDLPPLREEDDDAGIYAAVRRTNPVGTWTGAVVFRSTDDGATWTSIGGTTLEATVGSLQEGLGIGDATCWDTGNALVVSLDSGSFESRTESAVINGANSVAVGANGRWEIVQFMDAELIGVGVYRLTTLLRGRRGTEPFIGTSVPGDTVVLISDGAILRLPLQTSDVNQEYMYRAATVGLPAGTSGEGEPFTGQGRALEAWAPTNIMGERDGADDLTITFKRRARFGSDLTPAYLNLPLSETPESYEIDIMDGDTVVRTIATAVESAVYNAAQQTTDFGSPQTAIDVRIYQLSAIVGRGLAGEATI